MMCSMFYVTLTLCLLCALPLYCETQSTEVNLKGDLTDTMFDAPDIMMTDAVKINRYLPESILGMINPKNEEQDKNRGKSDTKTAKIYRERLVAIQDSVFHLISLIMQFIKTQTKSKNKINIHKTDIEKASNLFKKDVETVISGGKEDKFCAETDERKLLPIATIKKPPTQETTKKSSNQKPTSKKLKIKKLTSNKPPIQEPKIEKDQRKNYSFDFYPITK